MNVPAHVVYSILTRTSYFFFSRSSERTKFCFKREKELQKYKKYLKIYWN